MAFNSELPFNDLPLLASFTRRGSLIPELAY